MYRTFDRLGENNPQQTKENREGCERLCISVQEMERFPRSPSELRLLCGLLQLDPKAAADGAVGVETLFDAQRRSCLSWRRLWGHCWFIFIFLFYVWDVGGLSDRCSCGRPLMAKVTLDWDSIVQSLQFLAINRYYRFLFVSYFFYGHGKEKEVAEEGGQENDSQTGRCLQLSQVQLSQVLQVYNVIAW